MKLVSVNIEMDKHLHRVVPFVQGQKPDVVALQEVPEPDLPMMAEAWGLPHIAFAPMMRMKSDNRDCVRGVAILSRTPLSNVQTLRYSGYWNGEDVFDHSTTISKQRTTWHDLLVADVGGMRMATTHFVWTPNGQADDIQRMACDIMLRHLAKLGEMVLVGDFNAPRGGEIFGEINKVFTDNVPLHYTSSIDGSLHRSGKEFPYMVDGVFSTAGIEASGVSLHRGVSDHCAVVVEQVGPVAVKVAA